MNEQRLFELLRPQPPATLLSLLQYVYRSMTLAHRETVITIQEDHHETDR